MHLSCAEPDLMIGNFIADFLHLKEARQMPPYFQQGIQLHRLIDSFTDSHEEITACNAIFRPTQHKYAPVVVDIIMDYFLTRHWEEYSTVPLQEFVEDTYRILEKNIEKMPIKVQQYVPRMIADDFLMSCKDYDRLTVTFWRVKHKTKFANSLEDAVKALQENEGELERHFLHYYPQLCAKVKDFCLC